MEELESRGFAEIEGSLCLSHVTDKALRGALEGETCDDTCAACGRASKVAVPLEILMVPVVAAIRFLFAPADGLPWDSEEGVYVGPVAGADDVLFDVLDGAIEGEALEAISEALCDSLEDYGPWTDWGSQADVEHLESAWGTFSWAVQHQSRFVYIPDQDKWSPAHSAMYMLTRLRAYVDNEDLGLISILPAGSTIYRGRLINRRFDPPRKAADLGPAPPERAGANRMSPAGVSVLYAAGDPATAVAEIAAHGPAPFAVVGAFRSTRDTTILDLTRGPRSPSVFDEDRRDDYVLARFLKRFVESVTVPVIPDGREHVEYAPTQVVTEYLRWVPTRKIDGIALPSAQSSDGRTSYVFFVGPEGVADEDEYRRATDAPDKVPASHLLFEALEDPADVVYTLAQGDVDVYEVVRNYHANMLK